MRFLLLLVACGDDVTNMQMGADLSAIADLAGEKDLSVGGGMDLTLPPNSDLSGMGMPDIAQSTDMAAAHKRVFVTAGSWTGNLKMAGLGTDGLDGANKLCQGAATTAGLGGTWVAWLSDSTHDAKDRIADVGPWYRMDGMMVFANKAALTGNPTVAIGLTENNTAPGGVARFPFTGTDSGGTKDTTNLCGDWTNGTTGNGMCGVYNANDNTWTQGTARPCNVPYSLYCFEQ